MDKLKWLFKKLFKFFKWISIIFIIWFIILLISIYISSLNSYKESDFNIPKNFFDTKFWDKDPNSEENWFNDYVKFNELMNNIDYLEYFDILSKCIFDGRYIEEWRCEKDKKNYFEDKVSRHDREIDKDIRKNKNNVEKVEKLISEKYIKLERRKIILLKEFYKAFDSVDNKNDRIKYKEFIYYINKGSNNINTITDVWRVIDKITNWTEVDESLKNSISLAIEKIYNWKISLDDFKQYSNDLDALENIKDEHLEKDFRKFRTFIAINKFKYNKINNKEYLLETPEYSDIYIWDKAYWKWKHLSYNWLLKYSRAIRYVAYKYFEEWKYDKWIDILLTFQVFINNLINKYESDFIWALMLIIVHETNSKGIIYFIDNYNLPDELKEKIYIIFNEKIDEWLIENALKREHIINRTIFQWLWDNSFNRVSLYRDKWFFSYYKWIIINSLFYSVKESELISDKLRFDLINNKGLKSDFSCEKKLYNYIWRSFMCIWWSNYDNAYQREYDMHRLINNILEKVE